MFDSLLTALRVPTTAVPVSHFDIVTVDSVAPRSILIFAIDLFRRCTINNTALSVHSLMQRGCPSSETADHIVHALLDDSSTDTVAMVQIPFEKWLARLCKVPKNDLQILFQAVATSPLGDNPSTICADIDNMQIIYQGPLALLPPLDSPPNTTRWCWWYRWCWFYRWCFPMARCCYKGNIPIRCE